MGNGAGQPLAGVKGTQILAEDLLSGLEEFVCTVDVSAFCGSFELAGVSSLRFLVFCRGQGSWCRRKPTWSSWRLRRPPCVYTNSHLSSPSLQTDLRYEAQNLEHFQHNFQDMASVKFPTPLRPLITRDILVETYEVRTCFCGFLITGHSHRGFRLERRCGSCG